MLIESRGDATIAADSSWRIDRRDLPTPSHAAAGTLPPEEITAYNREFAGLELARPLSHYRARLEAIGFDRGERVLDAACGIGQWSVALAGLNAEVHGIDRAVERIALAERLALGMDTANAHYTHGELESLPFPDGYFDAVLCYGVLMFLDTETALGELSRVLRPGGRLYVCANGPGWALLLMLRRRMPLTGARTLVRGVRGLPGGYLTRKRVERAAERIGLSLERWAPEGTIRPTAGAADPASVYPGRYVGFECVWEAILAKRAAEAPAAIAGTSPRPRQGPTGEELVARLRERGGQFELPERVIPAGVTEVDAHFALPEASKVAGRVPAREQERRLEAIVAALLEGARSDRERAIRVIRFVQDAFYHHPLTQPPVGLSVYELLELGYGRCGYAAQVTAQLLALAGLPARQRQFPRHVIAEAFLEGEWRIADADAFKNGVIPLGEDGSLLTMRELALHPYRIDRFAPTGWWVRSDSRYARNAAGEPVRGYVEAINPDERGYLSSYYAPWMPAEHPPPVPVLEPVSTVGAPATIRLAWSESSVRDGALRGYRVRVGTTSRGWSYDAMDYERFPAETGTEVAELEVAVPSAEVAISSPGTYFWSVKAVDDHAAKEPGTYYWSSEEGAFEVAP